MTIFTIRYYKDYDNCLSETAQFLSFEAAYMFYTSLKAYVLMFQERRDNDIVIYYTTNRRSPFKGRVFCHPAGMDRNLIQVHIVSRQ